MANEARITQAPLIVDRDGDIRQVSQLSVIADTDADEERQVTQVVLVVDREPARSGIYAHGVDLGDYEGHVRGVPQSGDRSAWDDVAYPDRHARGMAAGDSHHAEVTLSAEAADILALIGQELDLETQAANTVLAGPASGVDAKPAFRGLVEGDLPGHSHVELDITDLDHTDENAIHDNVAGEIHAITEKAAPEDNDALLIEDSGAGYVKKWVKISSLPAGSGGSGTLANAGYQETVGDGVNTEFTVTHSLGTWDVLVQVYDLGVTPREQVGATVKATSADAVLVTIEPAPATDQIRVLVVAADVGAVSDAADLAYTPTTLTDWDSDADPGNTNDALDQLADRVDDLEAGGGGGGVTVEEQDGTPSVAATKIKFPNGAVTDDGAGVVSVAFPAGGGGGNVTHNNAYASPPTSPTTGDLWLPPDSYYTFRYNGAVWVPYRLHRPMTLPVDGDFAWVNEVGVTKTVDGGAIALQFDTRGADNYRLRIKAAPSTPYVISAAFALNAPNSQWALASLGFRQSSDGKLAMIFFGANKCAVTKYNSPTSFNGYYADLPGPGPTATVWLRIADNGTNRISSVSYDGRSFYQLHSVGRTDFITADQVFWGGQGGGYAAVVTLLSWEES